MDTQISNSFQNKMIPINLYPMDTYLDVVRPQTRSALSVVRLFPGGRSGFHFHWLSENIKKKNAEYTNVWNFTRLLHVVKARNFKPRWYGERKKSIDCNVIKGKTITKSNILRQGRINSMKTKINNFLFMSFLGYITNAGRNVWNGTHPMLTIPSQAVTLKPDLSYILHKCCQYSKSVLG